MQQCAFTRAIALVHATVTSCKIQPALPYMRVVKKRELKNSEGRPEAHKRCSLILVLL